MRLALLLAVASALAACRSARYEPATPRSAADGAGRVSLGDVRVSSSALARPPTLAVELEVSLSPSQQVEAVVLNSAYGVGCQGASGLFTVRGTVLSAWWPVNAAALRGPTTIDVHVADRWSARRSCLRVVLASGAPDGVLRETGRAEWFFSARTALELSSSPVTWSTIGVTAGAGSWLGGFRLSLATGIASARCAESLCGRLDDENEPLVPGTALPIDPELEAFLFARPSSALSLALRPGFRLIWYDEQAPDPRRRDAFTPALALRYWLRGAAPLAQYTTRQRAEGPGIAFELPVGAWIDLDHDGPPGWYGGLGAVLAFPVD